MTILDKLALYLDTAYEELSKSDLSLEKDLLKFPNDEGLKSVKLKVRKLLELIEFMQEDPKYSVWVEHNELIQRTLKDVRSITSI